MSETPDQPAETPAKPTGIAWGDSISPERLAVLKELFERQCVWAEQKDRDLGQSIFHGVRLTGVDVFWLAALAQKGPAEDIARAAAELLNKGSTATASALHLESAYLQGAQLRNANLQGAHLQETNLIGAQLQDSDLRGTHLDGSHLDDAQLKDANLVGAHSSGAYFRRAQLSEADLSLAQLTKADLSDAWLERAVLNRTIMIEAILERVQLEGAILDSAQMVKANLSEARLDGVDLRDAHLEGASLEGAQLEGADLGGAQLAGASLKRASFNKASRLNPATLDGVSLDQVIFDNTNLTVVNWETVKRLGDEQVARNRPPEDETRPRSTWKAEQYHAAARAYRSLSVALRNQGLSVDATRFHYRAELMERKSSFWQIFAQLSSRRFYTAPAYFGRWLLSWLLGTFAGYGDYFGRLLLTYVLVVSAFAGVMFLAAGRVVSFDAIRDVFVLSVTSFHGRGVQPPGLTMTDGLATLTAVEAFFGLLIEGIFIAAFTRRVTGN